MLDCVMRSGRTYDPGQALVAPKRHTRKGKATKEPEAPEVPGDDKTDGEHTENDERRLITFGSLPANDNIEGSLVLSGTGKCKGMAWAETGGVKVSPTVYKALTKRTPPIRQQMKLLTYVMDAREEADACNEADAPVSEREDSPSGTPRAAYRALGAELASDAAYRAPGTKEAPRTPVKSETGLGLEFDRSGETIFVTARTSCTLDVRSDDENSNESMNKEPQYIVSNDSLSTNHENLSWFDEKCKADGVPDDEENLPELDIEWYHDHWSRSDYLSTPGTENHSEVLDDDTSDGIRVNAIICEVDDYVLDDDEYEAAVLRLQTQERIRHYAASQVPSQTSGAGPSGAHRSPRVTVEEIDDEDAPHIVVSSDEDQSIEFIPRWKGKGKASERKKKNRPSLGIVIDDLQPPTKSDPDKREHRKSAARSFSHWENNVPDGFKSSGYAEAKYGRDTDRSRGDRDDHDQAASDPQQTRRNNSPERKRSARSRSQSNTHRHGNTEPTLNRISTATGRSQSGAINVDSDPSESPSGSDDGASDSDSNSDILNRFGHGNHGRGVANDEILRLLVKLQKENKHLKKKSKKQARSGYKVQAPKTYKGDSPDIEEYEQFLFDYDNWVIETGLSWESAVHNVSRFLGGKAARWYMAMIAPNLDTKRYTMKDVYQLMYAYCFPPDYKETLRKQYEDLSQGDHSVQDFFAELELYHTRLNDITNVQHVRRAWDGSARYIRAKWANRGLRPKRATFEELKESALDIERVNKIKRSIEHEHARKDNHKRNRSRSPDRKRDHRHDKPRQSHNQNSNNQQKANRDRERSDNWKKTKADGKSGQGMRHFNLTDEQKEKYRQEDRCFVCHKTGHMWRNCSKLNTVKPSGPRVNATAVKPETKVRTSSIMLKELDKLHKLKEKIELSSVRLNLNSIQVSALKPKKAESQGYVERNSVQVKDNMRLVPQTIVVRAKLNGEPIRALLDSGSQANILSSTIVDQLRVTKVMLTKPLQLQLAISGSKSMVNYGAHARIQYQDIDEERDFDVGNLDGYDTILGTPWLYQHSVSLSFNPTSVLIGLTKPLPLEGEEVLRINSISADVVEARMEELREMLRECHEYEPHDMFF